MSRGETRRDFEMEEQIVVAREDASSVIEISDDTDSGKRSRIAAELEPFFQISPSSAAIC